MAGKERLPGENSERKEWQRMLSFSRGRGVHFSEAFVLQISKDFLD